MSGRWADVIRVQQVRERSITARRIQGPRDARDAFLDLFPEGPTCEYFGVLCLDTQNKVAAASVVSVGLLNSSLVHPREVFQRAILANAASIILGHNHPSGDPDPSPEDLEVTAQMVESGRILGIPVRDHVIIADTGFVSLLEKGHLFQPRDGNGARGMAAKITASINAMDAS